MTPNILLPLALVALIPCAALAHEGHGLPGSGHWHASDTLLFVGMALVVAMAWYLGRRK